MTFKRDEVFHVRVTTPSEGRNGNLSCSLGLVSISFPRQDDASLPAVAVPLFESCVIQLATVSFAFCQVGTLA